MFLIRPAQPSDLEALVDISVHLDSVNLPSDADKLRGIVEQAQASFGGLLPPAERAFTFVLEDRGGDRPALLGCSMLFAQHGSRRAPHVYFDVLDEERYSDTLDRWVSHKVLRIGYNFKGMTEVGGLVLLPQWRAHPEHLGKLLSLVRFAFIAENRTGFCDEIVSELMPPLEPDGRSLLWESLGRRFTGMSYQEADQLSRVNKEFIRSLFPQEPIYACLLDPAAQALIGQVGPATRGVEHMLRKSGFRYAHRIDPFDGGPHFHARTDEVLPIRATRRMRVAATTALVAAHPAIVTTVPGPKAAGAGGEDQRGFRACRALVQVTGPEVALPDDARALLAVDPGAEVAVLPL